MLKSPGIESSPPSPTTRSLPDRPPGLPYINTANITLSVPGPAAFSAQQPICKPKQTGYDHAFTEARRFGLPPPSSFPRCIKHHDNRRNLAPRQVPLPNLLQEQIPQEMATHERYQAYQTRPRHYRREVTMTETRMPVRVRSPLKS